MFIINILFGCSFVFAFLANTASSHKHYVKFIGIYVITLICLLAIFGFQEGSNESRLTTYVFTIAFGVICPTLASVLYSQKLMESPVIYLNRKLLILPLVAGFGFLVLGTLMVLQPNKYDYGMGAPIFLAQDVYLKYGFLFMFIPAIILFFAFAISRTAFCQNGLLFGGLLWDWSYFKSYKWANENLYEDLSIQPLLDRNMLMDLVLELAYKTLFTPKRIRISMSYNEKENIERILHDISLIKKLPN